MKIAFYTNIVSPHQLPFARELVKRVGAENYRYIYSEALHAERSAMGWGDVQEPWILSLNDLRDEATRWLEEADVLILGHRDLALIERRCKKGLRTFYASERWFKPIPLFHLTVPGWLRLIVPRYFFMVRRFVSLARQYDNFRLLPYGVWAVRDFLRMGVASNKMTTWGYAVAPTASEVKRQPLGLPIRILWVGRMLKLKNVDTIIRAVVRANARTGTQTFALTLVGDGPEKANLQHLVEQLEAQSVVTFLPSCPIHEVRHFMRQHNVYVFASNGLDGWGAVVSEALEEGMFCLGTREAGAPVTLLPKTCQFHVRDVKGLADRLLLARAAKLPRTEIGQWSASKLAERFMTLCEGVEC